jgi:hypothetical protein
MHCRKHSEPPCKAHQPPGQSLAHPFAKRNRAPQRACFNPGQSGCLCGKRTPLTVAIRKKIVGGPTTRGLLQPRYAGAPLFTSL